MSGRPSARATVSHVCKFWPPPCRRTSSGADAPHTMALTAWPSTASYERRMTVGGASNGKLASAALSAACRTRRNRLLRSSVTSADWLILVSRRGLLHLPEHHPHLHDRCVVFIERAAVEPQHLSLRCLADCHNLSRNSICPVEKHRAREKVNLDCTKQANVRTHRLPDAIEHMRIEQAHHCRRRSNWPAPWRDGGVPVQRLGHPAAADHRSLFITINGSLAVAERLSWPKRLEYAQFRGINWAQITAAQSRWRACIAACRGAFGNQGFAGRRSPSPNLAGDLAILRPLEPCLNRFAVGRRMPEVEREASCFEPAAPEGLEQDRRELIHVDAASYCSAPEPQCGSCRIVVNAAYDRRGQVARPPDWAGD